MMVSIINIPNCGMLRANVAMGMPIDVVANRLRAAPAKNSNGALDGHAQDAAHHEG